jgi:hypothetical protein
VKTLDLCGLRVRKTRPILSAAPDEKARRGQKISPDVRQGDKPPLLQKARSRRFSVLLRFEHAAIAKFELSDA